MARQTARAICFRPMSFDILAPVYRLMERVLAGRRLHRCRCAFLHHIPAPQRILILGEGPGRFLVECRRHFPAASVTCVEGSEKMIQQARRHLASHALSEVGVEFIQVNALEWLPTRQDYDLIVTHFFLDCFRLDQLETLVPTIASASAGAPSAHWLLADFQEAPHGWRRWRSQAILALMYTFFRLVTRLPASRLTPPDPLLVRSGFELRDSMEIEWGLLKSQWWTRQAT